MLEAFIPYFHAPEHTLVDDLPLLGPLKLQLFGPLVAIGVVIGWKQCLKYAAKKDVDEFLVRDFLFWTLVSAFVISHWVSVIFYFPDRIKEDPVVLLQIWNGLSSVGGFFGAFVGMMWFLKKHKQPVMVYADTAIYGLLVGWCFGRAGCSVVHDHPGRIVAEGTFLAVGPWDDGTWRYDLGLLEFMFVVPLMLIVYFVIDVHKRRPGWLVGLVAASYAPYRFVLDSFRAHERAADVIGTPDARYGGLTTAQWFTITFFAAGIYLLFFRKPKDEDFTYAKDSERRKREAAENDDDDDDDDDDDADDADDDDDDDDSKAKAPIDAAADDDDDDDDPPGAEPRA